MKIRKLTKQEVAGADYLVWNAYIDLLAMESLRDLSPVQRAAALVFWYESEVQNGGHLQYFENRGADEIPAALEALTTLGAHCQHGVLAEASAVYLGHSRPVIASVEQYCEAALEGEFESFDSRFHACSPTLNDCLEAYLAQHPADFVLIQ